MDKTTTDFQFPCLRDLGCSFYSVTAMGKIFKDFQFPCLRDLGCSSRTKKREEIKSSSFSSLVLGIWAAASNGPYLSTTEKWSFQFPCLRDLGCSPFLRVLGLWEVGTFSSLVLGIWAAA